MFYKTEGDHGPWLNASASYRLAGHLRAQLPQAEGHPGLTMACTSLQRGGWRSWFLVTFKLHSPLRLRCELSDDHVWVVRLESAAEGKVGRRRSCGRSAAILGGNPLRLPPTKCRKDEVWPTSSFLGCPLVSAARAQRRGLIMWATSPKGRK